MWISKEKYNEFIKYEVFYLTNKRRVLDCGICERVDNGNLKTILELKIENENLKEKLIECEKKYADEFQKRLELVKLVEEK